MFKRYYVKYRYGSHDLFCQHKKIRFTLKGALSLMTTINPYIFHDIHVEDSKGNRIADNK